MTKPPEPIGQADGKKMGHLNSVPENNGPPRRMSINVNLKLSPKTQAKPSNDKVSQTQARYSNAALDAEDNLDEDSFEAEFGLDPVSDPEEKERREEESEESSAHLHYLFRIFTRGAGVTHKEPRGHSLELISAEQQQQ